MCSSWGLILQLCCHTNHKLKVFSTFILFFQLFYVTNSKIENNFSLCTKSYLAKQNVQRRNIENVTITAADWNFFNLYKPPQAKFYVLDGQRLS